MTSAPSYSETTQTTGVVLEAGTPPASWAARLAVVGVSLELMAFCVLIGILVVLRASHPEVGRAGLRWFGWGWGVAQLAVVVLGGLTAWGVLPRLREARGAAAMTLSGIVVMYGLAALGLKGVEWGRWGGPQIIMVPAAAAAPVQQAAAQRPTAGGTADAQAGGKTFGMTCAACHGPSGEGIANIAPALKDTDFVRQSTEAQVTAVVANGRAASDPASKTGKAMPARGGNPFLSDADVANVVAFLRAGGGAAGGGDGGGAGARPMAAVAPRWVVPAPPAGPQGVASAMRDGATGPALPADLRAQERTAAERSFAPVAAAMIGLHALHVLVGVGLMAALVWVSYAGVGDGGLMLAKLARAWWLAAVVMWLVLFPLVYVV